MDMKWGSESAKQFVTNVGLITSTGPYGDNVMTAEWTHHVSYEPGLIAVCIRANDATHANIAKTKEFGVNLCAEDQNVISSISGNNSAKSVNKIEALKELGYKFSRGKKIKALMVEGALLNVECKLAKKITIGDHTMFVGEAIEIYPISEKRPLVYHGLKYWKLGEIIPKPAENEMNRIQSVIERHKK